MNVVNDKHYRLMCDRTSVGSRMPPDPDSSGHLLCEGQTARVSLFVTQRDGSRIFSLPAEDAG